VSVIPKVTNICARCDSDQIEIHPNKIYTCKSCGKADKAYLLKLRFEFQAEDGSIEKKIVRNIPREMAGQLADHIGRALAVGIAATIEAYGAQVPKNVAPMILTRSVTASFESIFHIISAFLPLELQQQLAEYNALVMRANALMEASRNAGSEQGVQPPQEHADGDQSGPQLIKPGEAAGESGSGSESAGGASPGGAEPPAQEVGSGAKEG